MNGLTTNGLNSLGQSNVRKTEMVLNAMNGLSKALEIIILLILAFILAKVAEKLVKKLCEIKAVEKLLTKYEIKDENNNLKSLFSKLAYIVVFIFFLIPIFTIIGLSDFSNMISSFIDEFLNFIPAMLYAAFVIIIGIYVAQIVKQILCIALKQLGVNKIIGKITNKEDNEVIDVANITAVLAYIVIVIIFIAQGFSLLKLQILESISVFILGLLPELILIVALLIGTFILAYFTEGLVKTGLPAENVLPVIVRYIIIIAGINITLSQLGFNLTLVNGTYFIILIAIAVIAIIAFGIGGIETGRKIIEKKLSKVKGFEFLDEKKK